MSGEADERLVGELEAAIADTGALLVHLRKYRGGAEPDAAAAFREALALGDAARRLHRRDTLDAPAAARLLATARTLAGRLEALLAGVRDAPAYRGAVAAHAAGDQAALGRVLPAVFAGLEAVPTPPALFLPVAWRARGRPRPAADVARDAVRARDEGLPGEGDDLAPGTDPELPAVVLQDVPPSDEPVLFRLAGAELGLPVYRLADTGDHLVYVVRLRVPLAVRLVAEANAEEPRVTFDFARYGAELTAALAAEAIPVETAGPGR